MSNTATQVTTKGWGSRLMDSIKGIAIGFLLFFASFGVLYWNEGRTDMSEVAATAIEIKAEESAPQEADGALVSLTGTLTSPEKISDTFLVAGEYLAIHRNVEMYAWKENQHTESDTNTGGSETTTTTYTYTKAWTSMPDNSSSFYEKVDPDTKEVRQNPAMAINGKTITVQTGKIGNYSINIPEAELPSSKKIALTPENTVLADGFRLANNEYLYKSSAQNTGFSTGNTTTQVTTTNPTTGEVETITTTTSGNTAAANSSFTSPKVGDLRVSYSVIANPLKVATVFGELDAGASQINEFTNEDGDSIYRVFAESREKAIDRLATEHSIMTWVLRALGFFMMWGGLQSIFSVLSVFLDVLPFLGSISRGLVKFVTFIVSLILSVITIIVSMILHNIWALLIVVVLAVGGIYLYLQKKKNQQVSDVTPTEKKEEKKQEKQEKKEQKEEEEGVADADSDGE
jgi:hypothetical protein